MSSTEEKRTQPCGPWGFSMARWGRDWSIPDLGFRLNNQSEINKGSILFN